MFMKKSALLSLCLWVFLLSQDNSSFARLKTTASIQKLAEVTVTKNPAKLVLELLDSILDALKMITDPSNINAFSQGIIDDYVEVLSLAKGSGKLEKDVHLIYEKWLNIVALNSGLTVQKKTKDGTDLLLTFPHKNGYLPQIKSIIIQLNRIYLLIITNK